MARRSIPANLLDRTYSHIANLTTKRAVSALNTAFRVENQYGSAGLEAQPRKRVLQRKHEPKLSMRLPTAARFTEVKSASYPVTIPCAAVHRPPRELPVQQCNARQLAARAASV
jgi:hypothetical protein